MGHMTARHAYLILCMGSTHRVGIEKGASPHGFEGTSNTCHLGDELPRRYPKGCLSEKFTLSAAPSNHKKGGENERCATTA